MDTNHSIRSLIRLRFPVLLAAGLATCLLIESAPAVSAAPPDSPYSNGYVTNNPIYAIAQSGGTTYIGGNFETVGPRTGHAMPIFRSTGVAVASSPDVSGGDVLAHVSDGGGGFYIGGSFTHVGGVERSGLAHITGGGLDITWNPSPNGGVSALALDGSTLYVGGSFNNIAGQEKNRLAAIDTTTGAASSWDPNADSTVYTIAILGTAVVVGGQFDNVGGSARSRIAALNKTTGAAIPPINPSANGDVHTLEYTGGRLFAGGQFSNIGGAARSYIAELDTTTGAATAWNPAANSVVRDMDAIGSNLYAVGDFSNIGGEPIDKIAKLDLTTGNADAGWNPGASNPVFSVAVSPLDESGDYTVYAGGDFTFAGGALRYKLAEFNSSTGAVTSWSPMMNDSVRTLSVGTTYAFAGGAFTSVGAVQRQGLAALDSSGQVTSWNPRPNGDGIRAIAVSADRGTVYAGGNFGDVNGGLPRSNIAAFSASTGTATSWAPDADARVSAIEIIGSTIYLGGQFTTAGGQSRNRIAAIDQTTGTATSWNPNLNNNVNALDTALASSNIYAGGSFTTVGGLTTRNRIAQLSLDTGTATSWDPNASDEVYDIEASGTGVYVGGNFTSIGGSPRNYLAAIDSSSGLATSWNPNLDNMVKGVATDGSTVYAAGNFSTVNGGGTTRNRLAGFNISDAAATSWNPNADNNGETVEVSGPTVFAGGQFSAVSNYSYKGFAQFTAQPSNTIAPVASGSGQVGSALSCTSGTWNDENAAYTYQWLKDAAPLSGEIASTYTPVEGDVGSSISCRVTATNVGGNTEATSSSIAVTAVPVDPPSPEPSTPSTPATPTPVGDVVAPQITNLKIDPDCQRSKYVSTKRKRGRVKSRSSSQANKSKRKSHRWKKARSSTTISYTLSEDATVTFSIRAKKTSNGAPSRCTKSTGRSPGRVQVPGTYNEVLKIVREGTAGGNSNALSAASAIDATSLSGISLPRPFDSQTVDGDSNAASPSHAQKKRSRKALTKHGKRLKRAKRDVVAVTAARSQRGRAGVNKVRLSSRLFSEKLKAGSYKIYVTAVDAAGNTSSVATTKFALLSKQLEFRTFRWDKALRRALRIPLPRFDLSTFTA